MPRTRTRLPFIIAVVALVLAPSVLAQDHDHGAGGNVLVSHESGDDGRQISGGSGSFGWVLLDDAGAPARHNDGRIKLTQNGVTLFESASLHDYDGVVTLETGWVRAGPYEIEAEVPGEPVAYFNGTVAPDTALESAALAIEGPKTANMNAPSTFTYELRDAAGVLIPHTDVIVEARRMSDDVLVFRTHTHSHADAQVLTLAFEEPGTYELRFTGYQAFPSVRARQFASVVATHGLEVAAMPTLPSPSSNVAPMANVRVEDPPYLLQLTADPDVRVGPFTPFRSAAVVTDIANRTLVAHVDFDARIVGPLGNVIFASKSLHEYDGVLEVLSTNALPGTYTLEVKADRGSWKASATQSWTVVPPAVIAPVVSGGGNYEIHVTGLENAASGVPTDVTFSVVNAAGVPLAHSELEIALHRAIDEAPLYRTKLHTHGDGQFHATMTFPDAGAYVLRVDSFPLMPSPAVAYFPGRAFEPRLMNLDVAAGTPFLDIVESPVIVEPEVRLTTPGPTIGSLVVGAAVSVLLRRRLGD